GAALAGCDSLGGARGEWNESEHGLEIYLLSDRTGEAALETEATNVRYSLAWRKSRGQFVIEMFCREVNDGGECSKSRSEDFVLECDYEKERKKTENGENDRMTCTGPEGTYKFEPVI